MRLLAAERGRRTEIEKGQKLAKVLGKFPRNYNLDTFWSKTIIIIPPC
jgi:hypothetical protein